MYRELVAEEYQFVKKPYWITFALLLGYIAFIPRPHTTFDFVLFMLSFVHGSAIAIKQFNFDSSNPFLFTLPLNRTKLFLLKLSTWALLQLFSLTAITAFMALGLRSGVQQVLQSPFFPMVKWYELWAVPAIAFFSYMGYFFLTYMMVSIHFKRSFSRKRKLTKEGLAVLNVAVAVSLIGGVVCLFYLVMHFPVIAFPWDRRFIAIVLGIYFLSLALLILSTFAYRYVDVEPRG